MRVSYVHCSAAGASTGVRWSTITAASTGVLWGASTGINPGVTISAVPPELYAQCAFNAGGMTDFVPRGLQPRDGTCSAA